MLALDARLDRVVARQQALLRVTERALGLAGAATPSAKAGPTSPKRRRQRKPKARALQAAAVLQEAARRDEHEVPLVARLSDANKSAIALAMSRMCARIVRTPAVSVAERTSEIAMHTTVYDLRPDILSVVHAHPRTEHFKEDLIQAFYDGIKHKPGTTFGNVKADVLADKDPTFKRGNFCSVIRGSAWKG